MFLILRDWRDYAPTRIAFLLDTVKMEKTRKVILDRIISGEYKLGAYQVARDNWQRRFARIAYSFREPEISRDPSVCVGVSLGLALALCCAVNNGRGRLNCNEATIIENFRRQIKKRKSAFQNSLRFSTRVGRGRNKTLAPMIKLFENERNFRTTKYHQYTSRIIEFAIRHNAGVIQIERLESVLADRKGVLKDWAVAEFCGKLKYKAHHAGIEVHEIEARCANRRCSECGNVAEACSAAHADYLCKVCGYETHADYNAAKNMVLIGSGKIEAGETWKKICQG